MRKSQDGDKVTGDAEEGSKWHRLEILDSVNADTNMMYESPRSLREVCVDFICENLLGLCTLVTSEGDCSCTSNQQNRQVVYAEGAGEGAGDAAQSSQSTSGTVRLSFIDPDTFLPAEISDQLLSTLCDKKVLSDFSITLFSSKSTRLRHIKLKDASNLTVKGLAILKQHKIVDLEINGLKVSVNELIACLNLWSLRNLRSLSVARGSFMDRSRHFDVATLSKFPALQMLNVSGTEFNRLGLQIVVKYLPLLESLNISCTKVDDISPLKKCKNRLKTLIMYNLRSMCRSNMISVLLELNELRNLDISNERDGYTFSPLHLKVTELLKAVHCMPYLMSLDISGKEEIDDKDLWNFIQAHQDLVFLGLVNSYACYEDSLINPLNRTYRPDLVVSGTATEAQILEALRRYPNRPIYVQKCLYNLFRLTAYFSEARVDIIKLVIPGMRAHPQEFRVQMAATACLYNLTKSELATKIHISVLKEIVDLTLTAMESYPNHYQLQKNTLLTLCSDRILQDVPFDKYRCARLVMNCLSAFRDASMNRMSVAICSILAAKISTAETSMLGAQPQYMAKLLSMVRSNLRSKSVDITMKFTLSALWNLTDESATTCKVFLEKGGMELFIEVLESFGGESSVETKVLGLLNNIAEVSSLRHRLMRPTFITMLSVLLDSEHIDVSYFAAGIAAHLLSDGPRLWTSVPLPPTRTQLLNQLARAVTNWKTPQGEMVAYRSFQPFFPLLCCSDAYPVQLWAVWAIHHVCTKNPKRYCDMLVREGGVNILECLLKETDESPTQPSVQTLCQAILKTLAQRSC